METPNFNSKIKTQTEKQTRRVGSVLSNTSFPWILSYRSHCPLLGMGTIKNNKLGWECNCCALSLTFLNPNQHNSLLNTGDAPERVRVPLLPSGGNDL